MTRTLWPRGPMAAALALVACSSGPGRGADTSAAARADGPARFALDFIDRSSSSGLDPDALDDALALRLTRLRVHDSLLAQDPEAALRVWRSLGAQAQDQAMAARLEDPASQVAVAERPRRGDFARTDAQLARLGRPCVVQAGDATPVAELIAARPEADELARERQAVAELTRAAHVYEVRCVSGVAHVMVTPEPTEGWAVAFLSVIPDDTRTAHQEETP